MEHELTLNVRINEDEKIVYYTSDKERLKTFKRNNINRPVIISFYSTDDNKEGRHKYYHYFVLDSFQKHYQKQGTTISKFDIDLQLRQNSPVMVKDIISESGIKKSIKDISDLNKEEWCIFMYDTQQYANNIGFHFKEWL